MKCAICSESIEYYHFAVRSLNLFVGSSGKLALNPGQILTGVFKKVDKNRLDFI